MGEQLIFLNGNLVKKEDAKISVYDHGFLYGDGVFEGIRSYNGNVFRLQEHLIRLYESAKSILLTIPYTMEEMTEIIKETLKANDLQSAYIRLIISRGEGNLGIDPSTCKGASVIVIAEPLALFPAELYETGISIVTASSRRVPSDVLSPKTKTLNYLNNILVKIEAQQAGVTEALILNKEGYVAEGSADNIFIVKGNKVITPPAYVGALEGITRNVILEIANELGYEASEGVFTRHDVYVADEVFLTGTAAEAIAVVNVDGREIGEGKPGKVTNHILQAFRKVVEEQGEKVYQKEATVE
ncbi:branched-chain-amino-acid transaminase [Rummeliibacillus sp. JY-2-4R]